MKAEQMTVRQVTKSWVSDINNLLRQLVHDPKTFRPITLLHMRAIVANKATPVVIVRDDTRVVGLGMLAVITKFRGHYAYIEDMMVDGDYRGRGLGEAIARKLIAIARAKKVKTIELSTRPSRVPANKLYQKLGFEPKETNVYRLKL